MKRTQLVLKPIAPTVPLVEGGFYWMGASDSPDYVLYLRHDGPHAIYTQYPFYRESRNDYAIFHDLVERGTKRVQSEATQHLANLTGSVWDPITIRAYTPRLDESTAILAGNPRTSTQHDAQMVTVHVDLASAYLPEDGDVWGQLERMGVFISGRGEDGYSLFPMSRSEARDLVLPEGVIRLATVDGPYRDYESVTD